MRRTGMPTPLRSKSWLSSKIWRLVNKVSAHTQFLHKCWNTCLNCARYTAKKLAEEKNKLKLQQNLYEQGARLIQYHSLPQYVQMSGMCCLVRADRNLFSKQHIQSQ